MRQALLATAALLALAVPGKAAVISPLGINPTSATGHFSNEVGGTTFEDQYTFTLQGAPQFVTIASATNVYASSADFITNFAGQLFLQVGAIDADGAAGNDIGFGLVTAGACPSDPTSCQILAGTRLLDPGNYYLEITGTGGGQAGYGGDLTTFAVPGPLAGAGIPGLLAAFGMGGLWWKRRRQGNTLPA